MDFHVTAYGPEVARILALDGGGQRIASLVCDRRTPPAVRQALASVSARDLFPEAAEPAAPMAGLWPYFSAFDEAHALVDEPLTADGAYWHAIIHRQPDDANAEYWFREAGEHPIFGPLADDAEDILLRYADVAWSARPWDPFAFVEFCAHARLHPESAAERAAREIQRVEWQILFDHSARPH